MRPNEVTINHLYGTWRSTIAPNHFIDITIRENGVSYYDEILNDECNLDERQVAKIEFEPGEEPQLKIGEKEFTVFTFNDDNQGMMLRYPFGNFLEFRRY